jgi:hypothetical protein
MGFTKPKLACLFNAQVAGEIIEISIGGKENPLCSTIVEQRLQLRHQAKPYPKYKLL